MHRVLISDNLSPAGLKVLEDSPDIEPVVKTGLSPEQLIAELREVDGIIIRSATKLTPEVLAGQSRLRVIVRAGTSPV